MKQLVKGSAALTAVSVGEMVMRFVRTKCIALFLGTAGTGFLAQLTIFFELLRVWGDLGSRRGVIKQIAEQGQAGRESGRYSEIIKTSYFLAITASSLTAFFVTLLSPYISRLLYGNSSHYPFVIFLALLLPFASLSTVTASIVKGNMQYVSFTKYTFISYLGVMVLTPAVIYFLNYWGAVIIQALFFIFPLAGYLIFNSRSPFLSFSKKINWEALREQFSYGFVQIYQDSLIHLTRVLVAAWIVKGLGLTTMGIYQVIVTFSTVYMAIPIQAMSGYVLPLIASASAPKEVTRAINESLRYLIFLLTPVVVFMVIWPEVFIYLFFSKDFLSAAMPLQIQLLGTLFVLMGFPFGVAFQARGQLKAQFFIATLSPVLYIGLVWLFFDAGQLAGIAAAYLVTNVIAVAAQYLLCRHYYEMHLVPKNKRLLICTAVWAGFAFAAGSLWNIFAFRILASLLIVPWFLLSSKKHEREFLVSKWNKPKEFKKHFPQKNLLKVSRP